MKIYLVVLLAGLATCQETNVHETEQEFEEEYHKRYGTKELEDIAAKTLAAAEQEINTQNQLYKEGKAPYYEALNADSDMPLDELKKEKEGYVPLTADARGRGLINLDKSELFTHPELEDLYQRAAPPASYNSVTLGLVTPVKNQASCGSCAAFSTTGAHETCMLMSKARFAGLDLSEQHLLDCGFDNRTMLGCNGANPYSYGNFFATKMNGQSPHENSDPYLGNDPNIYCTPGLPNYNSGAYVKTPLVDGYCTEAKLQTLVSTYGAVVSTINADASAFNNYAGGVFNGCTSQATDHAILVVGYGTDNKTGLDYWLIKNSWGTDWGQGGYIQMLRGSGMCGIGSYCYTAQCAPTNGTLSDPPPVPSVPASSTCDLSRYFSNKPLTGSYQINIGFGVKSVTCINNKCSPSKAGPNTSNACVYVCGFQWC